MKRSIALLPALTFLLAACEEDYVQVNIRPQEDGSLVRTIHMWRADSEKPGEIKPPEEVLLNGVRSCYDEPVETEDASVKFRGTFRGVPPDIVREKDGVTYTNRGGYSVWRCRAGSFAAYRERRPGPTDHWKRMAGAAEGVDLGGKILAAMAGDALEGEKGLDRLQAWLRAGFPEDMKDLLMLLAGNQGAQNLPGLRDDRELSSGAALALQILAERGYIEVGALPELSSGAGAVRAFSRFVAGKMGRKADTALRAKVAALCDEKRSEALYARALASLGMTEDEAEEKLEPIGDLIVQISFGGEAHLTYMLDLPPGADVVSTSGRAQSHRCVVWEDRLDERPVTGIFFVTWSVPDVAWQKEHLGRTLLTGERLRDYVLWVEGLPEEGAKVWESEVEKLAPGPDLFSRIAGIHVSPVEEGTEVETEEGARILREALEEASK